MSNCVYCGRNVPLTKEHVLPRWLYEETKNQNIQLLQASPDKFLKVQQTVKDVCADCNNGTLSELDSYVKNLYDNYFSNIVHSNQSINFDYNFDFLARWLLKVSFNSARANKGDSEGFLEFLNYILHGTNRPPRITILLQLVTPHILNNAEKEKIKDENLRKLGVISPNLTRVSKLDSASSLINSNNYKIARMVMINSYSFYILIPSDGIVSRQQWKDELKRFNSTELTQGLHKLLPNENSIKVKASKVTAFKTMKHHLILNQKVYSELI